MTALSTITMITVPLLLLVHVAGGQVTVSFPISCGVEVQQAFNEAVTSLHSFWYDDAMARFQQVAQTRPGCGMALWGEAMCLWHPLWDPPSASDIDAGRKLILRGLALLDNQDNDDENNDDKAEDHKRGNGTARERDYMRALGRFFVPLGESYEERVEGYLGSMSLLHSRYGPSDPEAVALYALAINARENLRDRPDPRLAPQRLAGKLLEDLLRRHRPLPPPGQHNNNRGQEDGKGVDKDKGKDKGKGAEGGHHPGALHYLIHSYDYPELAGGALWAAEEYAGVAPLVPHAQHMPSHTFQHLGRWPDSIASNGRSMQAAEGDDGTRRPGWVGEDYLHALSFQVLALLQLAQDGPVRLRLAQVAASRLQDTETAAQAIALSAARFLVEAGQWEEAFRFQLAPTAFPWPRHPWAPLIVSFVRALAAARLAVDQPQLEEAMRALKEADEAWRASAMFLNGSSGPWRSALGLLLPVARAWATGVLADASSAATILLLPNSVEAEEEGQRKGKGWEDAVAMLEEAAREEEAGVEVLLASPTDEAGEILLSKLGDAREALAAFERSLSRRPNRFRAVAGAARAACELEGRGGPTCQRYVAMLLALCDPRSDRGQCGGRPVYRSLGLFP